MLLDPFYIYKFEVDPYITDLKDLGREQGRVVLFVELSSSDPDLAYPSNWWLNIKPLFSLFNNRPPTDAVIASAADLTLLHRRVRWNVRHILRPLGL
ncbi:hypothetical protein J6590_035353 [Homalodisca vitripennis]|nr:hypothetical protein J6590_035353 [Homalodisca vitripennis]